MLWGPLELGGEQERDFMGDLHMALSEIPHIASWTAASGRFHSETPAWGGPHSVKLYHMTCG